MNRKIDFHTHIGDIFHENKNITFKTNLKRQVYDDPFTVCEASNYKEPFLMDDEADMDKVIWAGQYRCWEWSLENMAAEMTKNGITYSIALPVWPNTTFEEYLAASKLDNRIIPFSSADFSLDGEALKEKLEKDIAHGAKGLKLHPTLQNISLRDEKVAIAVRTFGEADLPVITHVGENPYYTSEQPFETNPAYSAIQEFFWLAHEFPDYKLVAAHCCSCIELLAEGTAGLSNVYTDTTMCNAETMRHGVEVLGADKILFGSDVPFGSFAPSVQAVEEAFREEPGILDQVCYKNAATLIHLEDN